MFLLLPLLLLLLLLLTRCLLGPEIRDNPKVAAEFASLYHDLEGGINAISFFFPYAPIPSHRKRDFARKEVGKLFSKIIKERRALPEDQRVRSLSFIYLYRSTYIYFALLTCYYPSNRFFLSFLLSITERTER